MTTSITVVERLMLCNLFAIQRLFSKFWISIIISSFLTSEQTRPAASTLIFPTLTVQYLYT